MPRDMSEQSSAADFLVRAVAAEIVAKAVLKERPELIDATVAELKSEIAAVTSALQARRNPKAVPYLKALPDALDNFVKEIEALKPKA